MNRLLGGLRKRDDRCVGIAARDGYLAVVLVSCDPSAGRVPRLLAADLLSSTATESMGAALSEWVSEHHATGVPAFISVMPSSYRLFQIDAPEVPAEELRQAATWAVRDLVDYPLEQAVVDIFPPSQMVRRPRPQINVVAARRDRVCELAAAAREARLKPQAIDINELAQRNIAARLPELRGGSGVLVLGEQSGLLTLYREGDLLLARQIRTGLALLEADVERGGNDLQLELQRSLDYYESTLGQPPLGGLYVYPANEDVDAFCEWAQGTFQSLTLRSIRLRDVADADDDLLIAEDPGLLIALGAALRALS